jgi:hypothetical protein
VKDRDGKAVLFKRAFLIDTGFNWAWQGALHERIICSEAKAFVTLQGIFNSAEEEDGCRAKDPQKAMKDAVVLERLLEKEPNNSRYVFYLAMTYEDAKEYALALKTYKQRSSMGGSQTELFWSEFKMGRMEEKLGMSPESFLNHYARSYRQLPTRAEPLFYLADFFTRQKNYFLGYVLSRFASSLPWPEDAMALESWIYEEGLSSVLETCSRNLPIEVVRP